LTGLAAVTGATGFLGQHLVRAFAEAGWRVRILARRDPTSPFWEGIEPEVIPGDLGDTAALARLCAGADVVAHSAGLIAGAPADLERVNVEGSRRLAMAAGAAHLLQISSLAAREPQLSPYAASKRAGEVVAHEILGDRMAVIRPPAIYGPGDRETFRLFQLAARSPVLPVLTPKARVAVVHVQDAARQIVALAQSRAAGVFALSDARPEGYSWREIMQTAAMVFKRSPSLVALPTAALYAMSCIEIVANGWRRGSPMLTFGKVKELTYLNWGVRPAERVDGAPASEFDLTSGFEQTIEWYRTQGWLRA
jgi:nucleoside-diphosphate-sugar epimerase